MDIDKIQYLRQLVNGKKCKMNRQKKEQDELPALPNVLHVSIIDQEPIFSEICFPSWLLEEENFPIENIECNKE